MNSVEILVDQKALNGEGPVWDSVAQVLYWVDIFRATIFIFDPKTGQNRHIDLSDQFSTIGTLVTRKKGGLILAPDNCIASLDLETLTIRILAEPEINLPGNRFNDGKCDPAGRFLVGSMAKKPDGAPIGSLYSLEPDLSVRKLRDGLIISNGMGWSPDYRRFYLADSASRDIWFYDYDLERGEIDHQQIAFTLPDGNGVADGLTVDQEGMVWLAVWDGGCVMRWDPYTGKLIKTIHFPAKRTTCCVFGGSQMDELYITSATIDLQEKDWQNYPQNGALMRIKPGIKGMESFSFSG